MNVTVRVLVLTFNFSSDSSDVTVDETGDSGIASTESSDRDFYEM